MPGPVLITVDTGKNEKLPSQEVQPGRGIRPEDKYLQYIVIHAVIIICIRHKGSSREGGSILSRWVQGTLI